MVKERETGVLWVLLPLVITAERPAGRIEGRKWGEGGSMLLYFSKTFKGQDEALSITQIRLENV